MKLRLKNAPLAPTLNLTLMGFGPFFVCLAKQETRKIGRVIQYLTAPELKIGGGHLSFQTAEHEFGAARRAA